MSCCEEKGDEHNLDDGEDADPQKEDMNEGMLGSLWHRQSNGRSQSGLSLGSAGREILRADNCAGPEFPLLCTRAVYVVAS
ncbi:hypothetical protein PBY51_007785 [Eleginops maclovinus]|uniref:Uncharacterized protein n=1 Tax=Eleginops maclovinus TaxID=56733 RepID=A0AAN8AHG9_ELEMC|nr:hypothetical protein PBY51_007785 [Eleginops maclovinus]